MKSLLTLFALLIGLAAGAPAWAQQPTQAQADAIRQSCRADYQAHCASVPAGGSASLSCLQQNAASLSPPCRSAVAAVGGSNAPPASHTASKPPAAAASAQQMSPGDKLAVMRSACGRDYRAWCRGVRPGGGEALACLKAHESSLSRSCRAVLHEAASHR